MSVIDAVCASVTSGFWASGWVFVRPNEKFVFAGGCFTRIFTHGWCVSNANRNAPAAIHLISRIRRRETGGPPGNCNLYALRSLGHFKHTLAAREGVVWRAFASI